MRLKAGIWVKAYIRRCQSEGVQAVVVRHGDDDAGSIFIRINRLDGTSQIYGPAPAGLDEADTHRQLMPVLGGRFVPDAEADAYLLREREFDSDLWIVEVEARDGCHRLDGWLVDTAAR
jgi:hypothetical protein